MKKDIDFDSIKSMSPEQQQQAYYTLAKRANQRFRDIGKTGTHSYAVDKAQSYLNDVYNRSTFVQSKKLTGKDLKEGLKALEQFYNSKSSTMRGIKQIEKNHMDALAEKGIVLNHKEDTKKFYQFLSSQEFKSLGKYADSNQVRDDFAKAIDEGFSYDEIVQGYIDFMNEDMTFEQVAERREQLQTVMLH